MKRREEKRREEKRREEKRREGRSVGRVSTRLASFVPSNGRSHNSTRDSESSIEPSSNESRTPRSSHFCLLDVTLTRDRPRSRSTREQDRSDSRKPDEPIRLAFHRKRSSATSQAVSPKERSDYVRADHFILARSQLLGNRCPNDRRSPVCKLLALVTRQPAYFRVFAKLERFNLSLLSFLFFEHVSRTMFQHSSAIYQKPSMQRSALFTL